MNAFVSITERPPSAPVAPRPLRLRRLHLLAAGALAIPVAAAAFAISESGSARVAPPAAAAEAPGTAAEVLAAMQAETPSAAPADAESDTLRVTGTVGADLSASLAAAGVPEKQGREYIAALATAIPLAGGLSVADRFDLVILKAEDGSLGPVAYAGLDRVGRSDVELMQWTDGKQTRWVDADRLGASPEGMEMPVSGRVTSSFGERFHPILHSWRMHKGVDLAARFGTPIVAAASGRVVAAGWHGGYGRQVAIQHAGGLKTTYSHMSRIAAAPGETVRQGEVIGYVGSSGLATGPHLHYEVYEGGKLVNPLTAKLAGSPLKGEELHAFQSRLRSLLTGRGG